MNAGVFFHASLLSLAVACEARNAAEPTEATEGTPAATPEETSTAATPVASPLPQDARAALDAGQPLDDQGGLHFEAAWVREAGAGWIRINFRLGPYESADDPTWRAAYDDLVDAALAEGLQVYGLIGGEAVYSAAPVGSDEYLTDYSLSFVSIVDHFKDRVRVFESFNEPNNWVAPDTPAVATDRFAEMLQRLYLETKVFSGHADDPAWQVTIVSGGLFSFDLTDASDYLGDTYWYGRNASAWDWMCSTVGSYPIDGFGYHLYVREDPEATAEEVSAALKANVDGLLAMAEAQEAACPTGVPKRVWLSEVGWNASYTGEDVQARNAGILFDTFRDDPRVALYTWFTLQDFPGGPYGLFRADGSKRPAWQAFRDAVDAGAP